MNKEPRCIYPDEWKTPCIAGDPCEKYDNPLSCAAYKRMKRDGRLGVARRDGQKAVE